MCLYSSIVWLIALWLTLPYESQGNVPHVGDMIELVDMKTTWAINNVTLTASVTLKFMDIVKYQNVYGRLRKCKKVEGSGVVKYQNAYGRLRRCTKVSVCWRMYTKAC